MGVYYFPKCFYRVVFRRGGNFTKRLIRVQLRIFLNKFSYLPSMAFGGVFPLLLGENI